MKLPEGRTPHFLGPVCHSFILDIFGSCLFPWGRFYPDVASGIEQRLASLCHGSSCLYLETNRRSPGECLAGLVHTVLRWWLDPFWKTWEVSSHMDKAR